MCGVNPILTCYFNVAVPAFIIIEHLLASFFESGQHSLHHSKHGRWEFLNVMDDPVIVPEVAYPGMHYPYGRDLYAVLRCPDRRFLGCRSIIRTAVGEDQQDFSRLGALEQHGPGRPDSLVRWRPVERVVVEMLRLGLSPKVDEDVDLGFLILAAELHAADGYALQAKQRRMQGKRGGVSDLVLITHAPG